MKIEMIIYSNNLSLRFDTFDKVTHYPEKDLTVKQQLNFMWEDNIKVIVTNSPFIIANFDRGIVYTYNKNLEPVTFQTLGTDPMLILKKLSNVKSLIPSNIVNTIRDKLKEGDQIAYDYVNNVLGDSMEKAYLSRKLKTALEIE